MLPIPARLRFPILVAISAATCISEGVTRLHGDRDAQLPEVECSALQSTTLPSEGVSARGCVVDYALYSTSTTAPGVRSSSTAVLVFGSEADALKPGLQSKALLQIDSAEDRAKLREVREKYPDLLSLLAKPTPNGTAQQQHSESLVHTDLKLRYVSRHAQSDDLSSIGRLSSTGALYRRIAPDELPRASRTLAVLMLVIGAICAVSFLFFVHSALTGDHDNDE